MLFANIQEKSLKFLVKLLVPTKPGQTCIMWLRWVVKIMRSMLKAEDVDQVGDYKGELWGVHVQVTWGERMRLMDMHMQNQKWC